MIFYCRKCRSQYHAPSREHPPHLCKACKAFHATGPPATEKPPKKKPKRTPKD